MVGRAAALGSDPAPGIRLLGLRFNPLQRLIQIGCLKGLEFTGHQVTEDITEPAILLAATNHGNLLKLPSRGRPQVGKPELGVLP